MHASYKTEDVTKRDRFDYWREAVCDAYVRLGCHSEVRHDFAGTLDVRRYGTMAISNVAGSRHEVHRRRHDISQSNRSDFLLSLQLKKQSRVSQRGNSAMLEPMDFVLYGSTDPYHLALADGFEHLVLQFPKSRLLARLPNADMLTGLRVDGKGGSGRLVSANIVALAKLIETQPGPARSLAQESLLDMIAMSLSELTQSTVELSLPEQHIVLRAKSYVQANLGDLELNRDIVAKQAGLSVRRLNELFAKDGSSISRYIRHSRLKRVSEELRDPRFAAMTISEVACKWGFTSFQHFSALFRKTFGVSPREFRARTVGGQE